MKHFSTVLSMEVSGQPQTGVEADCRSLAEYQHRFSPHFNQDEWFSHRDALPSVTDSPTSGTLANMS